MIMNIPFLHFDDVMEDNDPEYFEFEEFENVTDSFCVNEGDEENENILDP